jgi:broad specificity phosphatase PhoE
VEHRLIYERDISEILRIEDITERTEEFTKWLLKRPEQNIVIVGHGTFLQILIESARRRGEMFAEMENCEVRSVLLSPDGEFYGVKTLIAGGEALL